MDKDDEPLISQRQSPQSVFPRPTWSSATVPSAPPSKPASKDAKTLLCNGAFPVRVLHRVCCSQREVIGPVILQTPDLRRSDADIMRAPLLIRADAGCRIGIGHLMRGLALAQAWQSGGGRAVFVAETVQELSARLRSEGFEHVPLAGSHVPATWH